MTGKLAGKIAVVTGATRGIGLAIAKRFVAEGTSVFITGRRQAAFDTAVKAIGRQATGVCGDSTKLADLDRLYDAVGAKAGRLDIVVANAGLGDAAPFGAISEAHFDKSFTANVKGTLFAAQKALPLLADGGAIILIGSIITARAVAGFSAYAASKAAIRSFARQWMLDLAPRRIRVNVISPGPIDTPGLDSLAETEEERRQFKAGLAAACRSAVSARPTRSPRRRFSSPRTMPASSTAPNCLSMAGWRRCKRYQGH
jgi:NAD(P)-dependent dehydrogenase (short-subunit alcohol dehydrogenase family)